eukprot:6479902-Alexandrium_andersonii.AAC.1
MHGCRSPTRATLLLVSVVDRVFDCVTAERQRDSTVVATRPNHRQQPAAAPQRANACRWAKH